MADQLSVTVAVLTYRRNDDLRDLLPALLTQLDDVADAASTDVLVVDNDAAGGARDVVAAVGDDRVRYCVEPRPGMPAARNRALAECADRDVLVFIDDDERPDEHWLGRLLATHADTGAAAVAGPVRSVFAGPVDPWIEAGGFFRRLHRVDVVTGTPIALAATNNLLLDLRVVREHGLRFPEDIGMAGGEDNLFTRSLTRSGGRIVWCAEAWVVEPVPADRATRKWVLERSFSSGNVLARVKLRMAPRGPASWTTRLELLFGGLARVLAGAARWLLGVVTASTPRRANGARVAYRGLGLLLGGGGYSYQAYRRRDPSTGPAGAS